MDIGGIPHIVVSFSWPDRITLVLVGALLGAFFAYVSNAIHSWRQKKTETVQSVAGEFLHLLNVLDESVRILWSSSRVELGASREIQLSTSINITLSHAAECLKLLFKLKRMENHKQQAVFEKMIETIGWHATSESFEMGGRPQSAGVILQSGNAILGLRIHFQEFIYR
ncbi:MAG: hypothetical protein OD918_07970 [Gammaproteobacteria bacterium]